MNKRQREKKLEGLVEYFRNYLRAAEETDDWPLPKGLEEIVKVISLGDDVAIKPKIYPHPDRAAYVVNPSDRVTYFVTPYGKTTFEIRMKDMKGTSSE